MIHSTKDWFTPEIIQPLSWKEKNSYVTQFLCLHSRLDPHFSWARLWRSLSFHALKTFPNSRSLKVQCSLTISFLYWGPLLRPLSASELWSFPPSSVLNVRPTWGISHITSVSLSAQLALISPHEFHVFVFVVVAVGFLVWVFVLLWSEKGLFSPDFIFGFFHLILPISVKESQPTPPSHSLSLFFLNFPTNSETSISNSIHLILSL